MTVKGNLIELEDYPCGNIVLLGGLEDKLGIFFISSLPLCLFLSSLPFSLIYGYILAFITSSTETKSLYETRSSAQSHVFLVEEKISGMDSQINSFFLLSFSITNLHCRCS
jgi:hypothetical protein